MRCPKCGLTSFDYNDACPKCGRDLAPLREQLGLFNVAPQPLFLLEPLLGGGEVEKEDDNFTFEQGEAEQGETEHLGTYDGDSSGVQEEAVSVADMEEVSTLEFEADLEGQAEAGLEMPSEGEIEFNISEEEPSLEIGDEEAETGITPEEPLDFTESDETLILEPEEAGLQLESGSENAETLIMEPEELETEPELALESLDEEIESLDLDFGSDAEEEPPRTDDDELDLAALDLEPEGLDFSHIESDVEEAGEVPSPSEKTEIRNFTDSDKTLIIEPDESPLDIGIEADQAGASPELEPVVTKEPETDDDFSELSGLDLEFEPEEETSGDKGDQELDLTGLSVEEEQVLTSGDDQGLTPSDEDDLDDLDDLESHLEDETLIIEDTDETLILEDSAERESPIFYDSDDEDDLDEMELDFDDLELELEEDN
jgi:hypothetical protein